MAKNSKVFTTVIKKMFGFSRISKTPVLALIVFALVVSSCQLRPNVMSISTSTSSGTKSVSISKSDLLQILSGLDDLAKLENRAVNGGGANAQAIYQELPTINQLLGLNCINLNSTGADLSSIEGGGAGTYSNVATACVLKFVAQNAILQIKTKSLNLSVSSQEFNSNRSRLASSLDKALGIKNTLNDINPALTSLALSSALENNNIEQAIYEKMSSQDLSTLASANATALGYTCLQVFPVQDQNTADQIAQQVLSGASYSGFADKYSQLLQQGQSAIANLGCGSPLDGSNAGSYALQFVPSVPVGGVSVVADPSGNGSWDVFQVTSREPFKYSSKYDSQLKSLIPQLASIQESIYFKDSVETSSIYANDRFGFWYNDPAGGYGFCLPPSQALSFAPNLQSLLALGDTNPSFPFC